MDQPDALNFFIPLAVTAAVAAAVVFIWRRGPVGRFAAALFVLPLLPAFNITAFIPEQIVHDRYLYLPLLGLLMAIYSAAEFAAGKFAWPLARAFAVACCLAAVPLTVVTAGYNAVWKTDLRLWQQAVTVDPGSAFNWNQLGAELTEQKRYSDAIEAYDRSLAVKRTPLAVMGRSRNLMSLQRYPEAISELQAAAKTPGDKINLFTLYQIYETLAIAQQAAGDSAGAEETLREGRAKMPIYSAALTEKLGVILYMQGRKQDALNELESVRAQAEKEMLIDAKVVYLRLGMLYAEAGRPQEARRDLQRFLDATVNSTVPEIVNDRAQAAAAIQRLR